MPSIYSSITGTGSYIPKRKIKNDYFLENEFLETNGTPVKRNNEVIVQKFEAITTIAERRYIEPGLLTSDMAASASEKAIESAGIDRESLDYIIVAHNFGDVSEAFQQVDILPTLAARVKHKLGIENPFCVAYDLPFGCPGWVQALIQADYFLKSGDAKRALVIGAETISRVCDPHDRDSMIYADGAGAVILEAQELSEKKGILTHLTRSDTLHHSDMLFMGKSYNQEDDSQHLFIKMYGRKLYQYALEHVPAAIKACLEKAKVDIKDIKKVLIHQANGKMDDAILQRLYGLYDLETPSDIMPMTVSWLGNSSVATVPTLLDLIQRGEMPGHEIKTGDLIVFASVGAGMNVNAVVYQM
ncbi:MAG: ketoacyl-ACP synthase III [Bacteroidota bacterium]